MSRWMRASRIVGMVLVGGILLAAGSALAQTEPGALARQSLRPYVHVFVAYALAWVLLMGWVVSIARRLGRLEERMKE